MGKHVSLVAERPDMPPQLAVLILDVLGQMRIPHETVLPGTGIRASSLRQDGSFISYRQMVCLVENSLDLAPQPGLGLLVGRRENISTWGILGYAIMSCPTYREAFYTGLRFQQTASGMMGLSAQETGGKVALQMDAPAVGRILPFCVEEMVAGITTVFRQLIADRFRPLQLNVAYPEPEYASMYRELMGCPVSFGQKDNILWVQAPDDTRLSTADPVTAKICRKLVEDILDKVSTEENLVREVRRILLRTPCQFPDMEAVAEELGISSRTLRRHLSKLGSHFTHIIDDVRQQLAMDYLQDSSLSIDHIASLLGYTEATNFRRAFRQWTGETPSGFRSAVKSPEIAGTGR